MGSFSIGRHRASASVIIQVSGVIAHQIVIKFLSNEHFAVITIPLHLLRIEFQKVEDFRRIKSLSAVVRPRSVLECRPSGRMCFVGIIYEQIDP